jgi:hypothetical protein
MSAHKPRGVAKSEYRDATPPPRPRKKSPRGPRVRLTHFEIRRGDRLRMRIAVANDAISEVGDELGALIKKIAPSTSTAIIPATKAVEEAETAAIGPDEFLVTTQHEGNVETYHADLHEYLAGLISQLCDEGLADALQIVREERARRAEGGN